eukprot:ANDGO_03709.mRNA.1 Acetyl-coenzyme A synthetase
MSTISGDDPLTATYFPATEASVSGYVSSMAEYERLHKESICSPSTFWSKIAQTFHWKTPFSADKVCSANLDMNNGPIKIQWFYDGETNICYNAVDRHVLGGNGDRPAFLFEGNDTFESYSMTYAQVYSRVCKFANVLKKHGVKKGDRVNIYMPMVPELAISMLACARIGAVHSVIFGGFSADSVADRIFDAESKVVITADGTMRGSKHVPLKAVIDQAILERCSFVEKVLVWPRLARPGHMCHCNTVPAHHWVESRDFDLALEEESVSDECPVEWVGAEEPLFMLYTSGSTGKPKGVVHTVGGYMVGTATTFKIAFDYHADRNDVYWCTADCGWITGHSYVCYGPMLNCATQVIFEGIPTHPTPHRNWEIIEKHKVTHFYTAPTAIRSLMRLGDSFPKRHNMKSLKVLGSVGEPINPAAWVWYHNVIGGGRCPVVDTYWQTETGSFVLTPIASATPLKPGSATLPFFGIQAVVLDEKGAEMEGECDNGYLCLKGAWPSMMRTVWGDHARFERTYFETFKGYYLTGDGCKRDKDGYITVTGRIDDCMNVSGHRIGSQEIESVLVSHPAIAEAAVVPREHNIKGQCIYAYVTPKQGFEFNDHLKRELNSLVRTVIGPFATPDFIHDASCGLVKTRSGKVVRRILRKIANHEEASGLGDTSTLAEPAVVEELIKSRPTTRL